jgi:hypothetical protein
MSQLIKKIYNRLNNYYSSPSKDAIDTWAKVEYGADAEYFKFLYYSNKK